MRTQKKNAEQRWTKFLESPFFCSVGGEDLELHVQKAHQKQTAYQEMFNYIYVTWVDYGFQSHDATFSWQYELFQMVYGSHTSDIKQGQIKT